MDINQVLGQRLRALRDERGWTLDALAQRSGVGRATISLIERGESSPTAVVLDRLATALGVALAALFESARVDPAASPLAPREAQSLWTDPGTGYTRRQLSASVPSPLQLVEVQFPAGQRLAYDTAEREADIYQQIWLLEGRMHISLGAEPWVLQPGDCLSMSLQQPMVFFNPGPALARYLVALVTLPLHTAWRRS